MSLFLKSVTLPSNEKIGILEGRINLLHIEIPNGVPKIIQEYKMAKYCIDAGSLELINLISEYANYNQALTITIDQIFNISDDVNIKYKALYAHCLQNKIVLNQNKIESSKLLISLGANLEQLVHNIQSSNLDNKIEKIDIDFI